jgi:hypothetical protein
VELKRKLYIFSKQVSISNLFLSNQAKFFLSGDSTGIVFYLKTAFAWICGLEKTDELDDQSISSNNHPNDNTSNRRDITPIHKEHVSSWHKQCSYVAIIILALCAFIWGFFTDYRIRLN